MEDYMEKLVPFEKNLCSKYAEKMISIKLIVNVMDDVHFV
jgi:hypothetical protein